MDGPLDLPLDDETSARTSTSWIPVKMPDLGLNSGSPHLSGRRGADALPAWQPMTFRGVAAFAGAPYGRLLVVQMVVALAAAISVVWVLGTAWEPVLLVALRELPDKGQIRYAQLDWSGDSPQRLAKSRFLSLVVDRDNTTPRGPEADLEIKLGRDRLQFHSLLGYIEVPYPRGWIIAVNRPELEPWWGAHRPAIFVAAGAGVVLGLWLLWCLMALPYAAVARFIGFWFDARLTWLSAWRLASAASLPGALVMAGAVFLYGWQRLSLVGLLLAVPLHFVIGWGYLLVAPGRVPRITEARTTARNPFNPSGDAMDPFSHSRDPGKGRASPQKEQPPPAS